MTLNSRDGSIRSDVKTKCNPFIETGRDHGLFYGSIVKCIIINSFFIPKNFFNLLF